MADWLTAPEIVRRLAARGCKITEKHVIAARRAGKLGCEKQGRCQVSEASEVDAWAEHGCEAGGSYQRLNKGEARAGAVASLSYDEQWELRFSLLTEDEQRARVLELKRALELAKADLAKAASKAASLELRAQRTESESLEVEESELRQAKAAREIESLRRSLDLAATAWGRLQARVSELESTLALAFEVELRRARE